MTITDEDLNMLSRLADDLSDQAKEVRGRDIALAKRSQQEAVNVESLRSDLVALKRDLARDTHVGFRSGQDTKTDADSFDTT